MLEKRFWVKKRNPGEFQVTLLEMVGLVFLISIQLKTNTVVHVVSDVWRET
jgi:hypothetical protein